MARSAMSTSKFCRRFSSAGMLTAILLALCACFPSEPGYYTAVRAEEGVLYVVLPSCVESVSRIETMEPSRDSMEPMWSMVGKIAPSGSFDGDNLYALSDQEGASITGSYAKIFSDSRSSSRPEFAVVHITVDTLPHDIQAIISRPGSIEIDSANGKFVSGDQPAGTLQELGLTDSRKLCR